MKKTNISALTIMGLLATVSTTSFANSAQENIKQVESYKVGSHTITTTYGGEDVKEEDKEVEELTPEQIVSQITQKVEQTDMTNVIELKQKYNAAIDLERQKTSLLEELKKQKEIVAPSKKDQDMTATSKSTSKIEKEVKEQPQVTEETVTPPVYMDQIVVNSVYGLSGNLFVTVQINGYKYNVSKGESFGNGYKVKEINKYGAKLEKDGIESFYNVAPADQYEVMATPTPVEAPKPTIYPREFGR